VYWRSKDSLDVSALASQNGYLVIDIQVAEPPSSAVTLRMDCTYPCNGEVDLTKLLQDAPLLQWEIVAIPLSCFADRGANLSQLSSPAVLFTEGSMTVRISEVALRADLPTGAIEFCP
jgi:beta-glucosidase